MTSLEALNERVYNRLISLGERPRNVDLNDIIALDRTKVSIEFNQKVRGL